MVNENVPTENLKLLDNIDVFLAEFEYLWDPKQKDSGHIDPNILSAGGFPFILHSILTEIYDDSVLGSIYEPSKLEIGKLKEKILNILKDFRSDIGENDLLDIAKDLAKNYLKIFCNKLYEEDFIEFRKAVQSWYKEKWSGEWEALVKVTDDVINLSFYNHQIWVNHKMRLIDIMVEISKREEVTINFGDKYLKEVLRFGRYYMSNLNISELSSNAEFPDFYVSWEANLGYLLKFMADSSTPNYTVYNDLHSNSGLFSLVPLEVLTSELSNKKGKALYSLLVHGEKRYVDGKYIIKKSKDDYPRLEHYNQECIFYYSSNTKLTIKGVQSASDILEQNKNFNQYAYTYEYFDKERFDVDNRFHRFMYLSSCLNAKSSWYRIYEEMEKKHKKHLAHPQTKINPPLNNLVNEDESVQDIIVKEGGWCSTGGQKVFKTKKNEVAKYLDYDLVCPIVQTFVPSPIFRSADEEIHGHIRKISILNNKGDILHLGYVVKLNNKDNINSSAFKSIALIYDEDGGFIQGQFIGSDMKTFYRLEDGDLRLNMSSDQWKKLLDDVKDSWIRAMYYINDYCLGDFRERFNSMVSEGILDKRYKLEVG